MTTSQPDPIAGFLDMIAERETALAELKAAVTKCQALDLFGQSIGFSATPIASAAVVAPVPVAVLPPVEALVRRKGGRPRKATAAVVSITRAAPADQGGLEAVVLAHLGQLSAPTTFGTVLAALKCRKPALQRVMDRLATEARIVRRGVRRGQTLGLPAVMGVGEPAAAVRERAAHHIESFTGLLDDRLATGASYAFEELVRAAVRVSPSATGDAVKTYLESLVRAGKAARIPAGDTVRYQRRVAPKAKAS